MAVSLSGLVVTAPETSCWVNGSTNSETNSDTFELTAASPCGGHLVVTNMLFFLHTE